MALTGTYQRNLDDKNRVAIPKRLRDQFQDKSLASLYVAPGTEKSLALYSPHEFERLAERLSAGASNRPGYQNYLRLLYGRTEEVQLDSQGRVRLPDWLVEFAGLKKDVVLLGVQDHAEIWDQDHWQEFLSTHGPAYDEMAATAFE